MLIDQNAVDDLLQESYFRFLKAGLPAATEPAHKKNYLYRIATNLAHDHRKSRKLEVLPEELPAASKANCLDQVHDIRRALARLKARERDALWLAYVECFNHREIAGILQVGAASIRPMLAGARAKFAEILRRLDVNE
jgi:RNA polymerase sigma-70 factor (ECF subfamily)